MSDMPTEQGPFLTNKTLAYNRLSFKGSHNSYQRDEDLLTQIAWNSQAPWQGGCRGVELDITRRSDISGGSSLTYFQVSHEQNEDGPPLAAYLGYLLSWHLNNVNHDVLCIHLDIKNEEGDIEIFPDEIDTYLRRWFSQTIIFRPFDLTQGADLVPYVQQHEWPELRQLVNKFIVVLTGTEEWKARYARNISPSRLCFADIDVADDQDSSPPTAGNRAIANFNLFTDQQQVWKQVVAKYRKAHFLVRGFGLNDEKLWNMARNAGVNMLATDQIRYHCWARVGDAPFAQNDPTHR